MRGEERRKKAKAKTTNYTHKFCSLSATFSHKKRIERLSSRKRFKRDGRVVSVRDKTKRQFIIVIV
jgi:hypothetical protein